MHAYPLVAGAPAGSSYVQRVTSRPCASPTLDPETDRLTSCTSLTYLTYRVARDPLGGRLFTSFTPRMELHMMRMSGSLAAAREQMAASAKLRSLVGVDSDACFARRRQQSDEPRNESSSLLHLTRMRKRFSARSTLLRLRFGRLLEDAAVVGRSAAPPAKAVVTADANSSLLDLVRRESEIRHWRGSSGTSG